MNSVGLFGQAAKGAPWSELLRRACGYVFSGGLCACLAFAVFSLLVEAGLEVVPANVCAWASGVGLGFVLNRRVTFHIKGRHGLGGQLRRFLVGSMVQLAFSNLCLLLLVEGFNLPAQLAWLTTLVLGSGAMFAYLNWFAFAGRPSKS